VVLEVEDDGVGISAEGLAERRFLGLLGMRERVAVFGDEIERRFALRRRARYPRLC
jgi:signal transduction histidine kinase